MSQDNKKMALLEEWRKQFRDARPDLQLTPAGSGKAMQQLSPEERAEIEIMKRKAQFVKDGAKDDPRRFASMIKRVIGK